jgi:hypothetical protein
LVVACRGFRRGRIARSVGAAIQRAIGAGINGQIQQSNRQMEDTSAYARDPAAWHGMPPY